MKYFLFLSFLSLFISNFSISQTLSFDDNLVSIIENKTTQITFENKNLVKKIKRNYFFDDVFGTIGFGVGQEYFFGVKGSLIKPFSFRKKRGKSKFIYNKINKHSGFYPVGGYVSIDPNMFVFFAGWVGVGLNAGISLPFVTIDNSIVIWGLAGPSGENGYGRLTYNPKIGIYAGPVWFKVGPSFVLAQQKEFSPNWIKINNNNFNFELSYIAEF